MFKHSSLSPFMLILGVLALVVSCGKKAEDSKYVDPIKPPITDALEEYLGKQEVVCESGMACPDYLAKIVVMQGSTRTPRVCSAFLTDTETIATSASCLTSLLYLPDQDCSKDVFIFFPKTFRRPAERVGCSRVIQVSQPDREDPVYTRSDIAFLSLQKSVKRSLLYINSKDGLHNDRVFTRWSIEQPETEKYTALIRREECRAVHNSFINPLANKHTSPNMIFGDCPFRPGNTGAPIVDNSGKLRAVTSQGIRPRILQVIYDHYRKEPLKDMFYATNMTCAPSIYDSEVSDERECAKALTYEAVAEARGLMTDSSIFYKETRKKIEDSLDAQSRFLKFSVKFVTNTTTLNEEAVVEPKCFKNYQEWRSYEPKKGRAQFQIIYPEKSYRFSTDAYGRIIGSEVSSVDRPTDFEFNTRVLRYEHEDGSHKATLTMKNEVTAGYFENFTLCK